MTKRNRIVFMQKRKNFFPVFMVFLILAVLLFVFSRIGFLRGLNGLFEQVTVPLQRMTFGIVHISSGGDKSELAKLKEENAHLTGELTKNKEQERENQALRDQFQVSSPAPRKLLPAHIIGIMSGGIVIDKGQSDGQKVGSVVVYKDNLVGKISKSSEHISVVELLTSKNISLTAKTVNTGALGVVNGSDDGMILRNVVLSEKLQSGDIVSSKGSVDSRGLQFPPDLVIGKIVSVNKKASSLFQSAEVKSLVDIERLDIVFVMIN